MALITNHGILIPQFEDFNDKIMYSAHSYFTPNALDCRNFDSFFEKIKIIFVVKQCFSDKSTYL